MNIKELKEFIKDLPDEMDIVLLNQYSDYYLATSADEQCFCEADESISGSHVLLIS